MARPKPRPPALVAEQALALGNFDEVMRESHRVLSAPDSEITADGALFTLGIAHAHPQNPARSTVEATHVFARLIREHPHSPWANQARIWLALLREQETAAESRARLGTENAALGETNKRLKDELESVLQSQKKLREEIENLQQVIKKMKQVDIEIEEKKREKAR